VLDSQVNTSNYQGSWEIVPTNTLAAIVLGVLFVYLFFRHALFVFMVMDLFLGWLRAFSWFPKEGRRFRTFVHWIIALSLFLLYLLLAGVAGWLDFIHL